MQSLFGGAAPTGGQGENEAGGSWWGVSEPVSTVAACGCREPARLEPWGQEELLCP